MARNRNATPTDEVDTSLAVATLADVLFKPLEKGGERFLQLRTLKLELWKRELSNETLPKVIIDSEEDINYLKGLEPTEWKDQDHYAVLALKHMRFRATEEDIKKAYRLRVLRHHPDKRMGAGEQVNPECDYFACIVKAFETLTGKRQAFDSVDPEFDNYIPPKVLSPKDDFFTIYGKWFDLNSRWSNVKPVPFLGNINTPRERVEQFYAFWYEFDSWREYSYLDEEEKEKGQFREERRWIDKQNKAARAKLKKEEMTRIRSAVDNAYDLDPRITMFKERDNQAKMDKKLEKQKVARERQELEEKIRKESEEKAREERDKLEAEEREKELNAKKEKDAIKRASKKEKKTFRTLCKANNYYGTDEKSTIDNMTHMETLCEVLDINELEELNKQLQSLSLEVGMKVFTQKSEEISLKIEAEKAETARAASAGRNGMNRNGNSNEADDWNSEELALLIKAVNVFPAGTVQRWEVVANFLFQHGANKKKRTAKEVLAKAKDLKGSDFSKNSLKQEANQQAYAVFEKNIKSQVRVEAEETKRDDDTAKKPSMESKASDGDLSSKPWTAEEQKLLEQALKTYPSTHSDRWDVIAGCVPGRNKKECMARFKELAALVKAKKMAQKTT